MTSDVEERLRAALSAQAEQWRVTPPPPSTAAAPSARRRPGRQLHLMLAAAASVTAVVLVAPAVAKLAQAPGPAAPAQQAAAPEGCVRPPANQGVPDCPVDPPGVGATGTAEYLPPEWSLYRESREAVPTGSERRVDSLQRRYGNSDGDFFVVTVNYGDVDPPTARAFGGRNDPTIRPDFPVLVLSPVPGAETQFMWSPRPRVNVEVDFVEGPPTVDMMRRVVRGIRS